MTNSNEHSHYSDGMTPSEVAEYLKVMFPEFGNLDDEEVRIQQESVFHYIENNKNQDATFDRGQSSNTSLFFAPKYDSPYVTSLDSQLALDEALARSLELGDDFNNLYISEPAGHAVDNTRTVFQETPSAGARQPARQDNIDPNRMTYDELQSQGETVGRESKGLPMDLIARLPTFKYKAVSSSNRKKKEKEKEREPEQCVICCIEYTKGTNLTTLPCLHNYHSDCITQWLQIKKHCPVCQNEVKDK